MVTPERIKELVPFIDESVVIGGFYTPGVGVVDSLARRHVDAREGTGDGGTHRLRQHRAARHRRRRRPDHRGTHRPGRRRDVDRRGRVRPLEPAHRCHGGRAHPTDAGRSPDDRRRPGAAVRRRQGRHRVPDRARHGHEHVRAPDGHRPGDRVVRPPRDPARPRGPPLGRGGAVVADGVPVHRGGLRAAATSRRSS